MLRPGDANEAAEAWKFAIGLKRNPSTLILSRQPMPTLDRTVYAPASGVQKGAYVLADPKDGKAPEVILMGTGSELNLCVQAFETLKKEGIAARVVSMPCWEQFELQDQAYQDEVLPPSISARVAVEQAATMGWEKYTGRPWRRRRHAHVRRLRAAAIVADEVRLHARKDRRTRQATDRKAEEWSQTRCRVIRQVLGSEAFTLDQPHPRRTRNLAMNPMKDLESCGQSPWLDDLHKTLMSSGELAGLIEKDGLKGLTSNPSIFEKAIGSTHDYDDVLKQMLGEGKADDMTVYETIAIADIQAAADAFRPVYEAAKGADGFVSLEVAPNIANDTEATKKDAKRLWAAVDRPNLMIKIPGTDAGTPAIQATIAEGINVNVTLLFAVKAYEDVAHAYIAGLEELAAKGGDVSRVASVASFFLSRIDSATDAKIAAVKDADPALVAKTKSKIAIANAKRAYQRSKVIFSGPKWEALAAKGAHPQRLLWASTGTKDKALPDTYYVDNIIGRDTVNTMPPATMKAFRDHGPCQQELDRERRRWSRGVA